MVTKLVSSSYSQLYNDIRRVFSKHKYWKIDCTELDQPLLASVMDMLDIGNDSLLKDLRNNRVTYINLVCTAGTNGGCGWFYVGMTTVHNVRSYKDSLKPELNQYICTSSDTMLLKDYYGI